MGLKEKVLYWAWEIKFRTDFIKLCTDYKIDVINPHFPGNTAMTLSRIIKWIPSRPKLYISFHGTDVNSHKNSEKSVIFDWQNTLRGAEKVVACSKNLGEQICQVFDSKVAPVVILNGIDTDQFTNQSSNSTPHSHSRRFILSVGKFNRVKGQDVLIKAFALISDDFPDVDLILIGASGDELPQLKALCSYGNLIDRVFFHQDMPHSSIPDYFKFATLFVLPSRREPFGIVILEAGAFSIPVIASRVNGIPEILTEGDTGKMIPADDPKQLEDAMRFLLDHPSEAKAMGIRLQALVEKKFTWKAAMEKYLE